MTVGPVEIFVIAFKDPEFHGEIRAELEQDRHVALEVGEELTGRRALVLAEEGQDESAAILSPR